MAFVRTPLLLTAAGVIPFAAAAMSIHWGLPFDRHYGQALMLTYGAVILSFLGGVQWGYAVRDTVDDTVPHRRYFLAVIPSLVAWGALLLPDGQLGLNIMIIAFAWTWLNDWRLARNGGIPPWFMHLRSAVTSVVILFLIAGTLGATP
jgi:Protein of unknown function (DUF3429)